MNRKEEINNIKRIFLIIVKNIWKMRNSYKMNKNIMMLGKIFGLFAEIYIWKAILYSSKSFEEMCTYIFAKTFVTAITKNNIITDVNKRVRTGQISMDISRPLSFPVQLVFESIGYSCFQVIFMAIPVMLIEMIFFKVTMPDLNYIIYFMFFSLGAMGIKILLSLCIAAFSFYVFEIGVLNRLLEDVISLFSGSLVPLWFFPKKLYSVAEVLPFQFIIYIPVTIYMGQYTNSEIYNLTFKLIIFIVLLFFLATILWNRALKKVMINGG